MKYHCKIVFLHNNSEFVPLKRMVWSKKKKLCTECYNNFYQFFWLHLKFVWNRLADTASILNLYFFPNTSISYNSVASYLLANSLWRILLVSKKSRFFDSYKLFPILIPSSFQIPSCSDFFLSFGCHYLHLCFLSYFFKLFVLIKCSIFWFLST